MQNTAGRLLRSDATWTVLTVLAMAGVAVFIAGGLLRLPTPLVVVGLGGLLACAAILAQPHLGLLLFLGLHYLIPILFPQNPQIESLRLPLCVSSLTLFAWLVHLLGRGERFSWSPHLAWMGLFGVGIVASVYGQRDHELFVEGILDAGRLVLLFVLLQQLPKTEERFRLLLHAFLLFNLALALSTLYGWWSGSGVILDRGRTRAVLAAGNFSDPNDLAAHLSVALPVALLLASSSGSFFRKVWGASVLVVLLFAVFVCGSRGGLIGAAVGMAVFILHRGGRMALIPVVLGLGFMLVASPLGYPGESLTADDSAMGRVHAWQAGLAMFQQHPLVGVGYEQFRTHHTIAAHNTFVQALAEGGLVTAVAWVGLQYWALLTLARVRRASGSPTLSGYAAALQGSILAGLTAGMFLSHTYRPIPLIALGMAAALGLVACKPAEERGKNWPHYAAVPAITAVGLGVLYVVVRGLL